MFKKTLDITILSYSLKNYSCPTLGVYKPAAAMDDISIIIVENVQRLLFSY